jgi:hypothetical protein
MQTINITNSNVTINTTPNLPKREKHFKKMWKIGGWRLYLTHNFRLKNSQSRDQERNHNGIVDAKRIKWAKTDGHCEMCGVKIEKFNRGEIHHILPWWRFPQFETDQRNLLILCHDCHHNIHVNPFIECRMITAKAKELGINLKEYYDV